jgi:hypothetical protein
MENAAYRTRDYTENRAAGWRPIVRSTDHVERYLPQCSDGTPPSIIH